MFRPPGKRVPRGPPHARSRAGEVSDLEIGDRALARVGAPGTDHAGGSGPEHEAARGVGLLHRDDDGLTGDPVVVGAGGLDEPVGDGVALLEVADACTILGVDREAREPTVLTRAVGPHLHHPDHELGALGVGGELGEGLVGEGSEEDEQRSDEHQRTAIQQHGSAPFALTRSHLCGEIPERPRILAYFYDFVNNNAIQKRPLFKG